MSSTLPPSDSPDAATDAPVPAEPAADGRPSAAEPRHEKVPRRALDLLEAIGRSPAPARLWSQLRDEVHSRWPDVPWEESGFAAFVADRLPAPAAPERLSSLHLPDLYLAFACLHRLPGAATAFESFSRTLLTQALASRVTTPGQVDDIRQAVYEKLFSGTPERPPAIHKYDGVGSLASWVRVTAVRMVLNVHRSQRRERPLSPGVLMTRPDGHAGPEEGYLKRLYSSAFKEAFEAALGELGPGERNLLRYYYLEGLTVAEIGALYHVHKATISRRLSAIREALLNGTRNRLLAQLDVERPELESILRLIGSQMDASICRYLEADAPQAAATAPASDPPPKSS